MAKGMTGFVKTPQSGLAIERQKQKALKFLDIGADAELTQELVMKAFHTLVRAEHPDSTVGHIKKIHGSLNDKRNAKDFLIRYIKANEHGTN